MNNPTMSPLSSLPKQAVISERQIQLLMMLALVVVCACAVWSLIDLGNRMMHSSVALAQTRNIVTERRSAVDAQQHLITRLQSADGAEAGGRIIGMVKKGEVPVDIELMGDPKPHTAPAAMVASKLPASLSRIAPFFCGGVLAFFCALLLLRRRRAPRLRTAGTLTPRNVLRQSAGQRKPATPSR